MTGLDANPVAGRASAPIPFPGRERRRQAVAYAGWLDRAGGGVMPQVELHLDTVAATTRAPRNMLVRLTGHDAAFIAGKASDEDALVAALRERASDIAAASTPLAFRAEFSGDADGRVWRGILLPLADAYGQVVAVETVYETLRTVTEGMLAGIGPVLDVTLAAACGTSRMSPWTSAGERAEAAPAQSWEARLALARTWAALPATGPLGRTARHAALGAACDLLLAARGNPLPLGKEWEGGSDAIVALVFGRDLPADAARAIADVLDHAMRLGIGARQLAPLLDRHPGGADAFATAERRLRLGLPRDMLSPCDVTETLTLTPLDGAALLASLRRAPAGGHPAWRAVA